MKSFTKIVERRLASLSKDVEKLVSYEMLENMEQVSAMRESLNLQEHLRRDFSKIRFDHKAEKLEGEGGNGRSWSPTKSGKIDRDIPLNRRRTLKVTAPSNRIILSSLEAIQPFVNTFEDVLHTVSCWLEIQKTQFQTGNSFGNEVITEVQKLLDSFATIPLLGTTDYFESRAKLVQTLEYSEGIEDAFFAVDICDYNYIRVLDTTLKDIESAYLIIYDSLHKNWKQINTKGKSATSLHTNMY